MFLSNLLEIISFDRGKIYTIMYKDISREKYLNTQKFNYLYFLFMQELYILVINYFHFVAIRVKSDINIYTVQKLSIWCILYNINISFGSRFLFS